MVVVSEFRAFAVVDEEYSYIVADMTSNTGGFGIDGILSTLVGASLADKEKLFFAILGDLAFFYDMNVAGNRHVGNNIRILFINNGKGTETMPFAEWHVSLTIFRALLSSSELVKISKRIG